ncbi:MAG TPA: response regulator transcription factor [Campylobacterales bacterium]|nr:response regulator transcription factor [Campylobacterales bacterium]
MKILFLEDEYALRISVEEFLNDLGLDVDTFENGDAAFDAIYEGSYNLLLLDVKVPGMDGFELLKALRERDIVIPALFITSLTHVDDLVHGYELGCCDYIKKPFDLKELQIRVEHALRSECLHAKKELIRLNDIYAYDTKNFILLEEEKKIELTKTEKRILESLIKHRGSIVSIEAFQEEVWGEDIDPANIRVQINKLRKKLASELIVNVRGLGYKIDA